MKGHQNLSIDRTEDRTEIDYPISENVVKDNLHSVKDNGLKTECKIIKTTNEGSIESNGENFLVHARETKIRKEASALFIWNSPEAETPAKPSQNNANLFRL